jgi:hypothetical protein
MVGDRLSRIVTYADDRVILCLCKSFAATLRDHAHRIAACLPWRLRTNPFRSRLRIAATIMSVTLFQCCAGADKDAFLMARSLRELR